ncbi:MAG TPA: hypothetical protein VLW85_09710 [Myxococcales bacterium]|nr:hypothetical protein [Myxococcales bacterium]
MHFLMLLALAGPCDGRELTRAFHERLEALAEPPEDATVTLLFRSDTYVVEVAREGRARVTRTLPLEGGCDLLAETAALVAERVLRALPAVAPSAPDARETIAVAPPPLPVVEQHVVPIEPEPVAAPLTVEEPAARVSFSAGGAGLLQRSGWQPGFQVQVARTTQSWSLAATFALSAGAPDGMGMRGPRLLPDRDFAFGQQTGLFALSAGRCLGDWLRTCAGPYVGIRWAGGATSPEVGGALGIDLALAARLHFGLSLLGGTSVGDRTDPSLTAAATLGVLVF